jgi:hypothetical protein
MIRDYVFLTYHPVPRPYAQQVEENKESMHFCYLNLPYSIVTSCMKTLSIERKNYADFGSKLIELCHVITVVLLSDILTFRT